jgi:hypothetical protein
MLAEITNNPALDVNFFNRFLLFLVSAVQDENETI